MPLATTFRPGDLLVIRPHDDKDPDAQNHAGERCIFVRRIDLTGHAQVRFAPGGKLYYFRMPDLIPAPERQGVLL